MSKGLKISLFPPFFFLMAPPKDGRLMILSSFFISFIKLYYSCSNYFLWLIAVRPAGFYPFFILKPLSAPLPADEAGLCKALLWAHCGQMFWNGFLSLYFTSGICGFTPFKISYIYKSFVKSYKYIYKRNAENLTYL